MLWKHAPFNTYKANENREACWGVSNLWILYSTMKWYQDQDKARNVDASKMWLIPLLISFCNTQQTTKHQRNRFISLDLDHYRIKTKAKLSQLKGKRNDLSETSRKCIFELSFKHICRKPDVNAYFTSRYICICISRLRTFSRRNTQDIIGLLAKDLVFLTLIWELSVSCLRDLAAK